MRDPLVLLIAGLLGLTALWGLIAVRAWSRRLRTPDLQQMTERQRADFLTTTDYARLRETVRLPMYLAALLVGLLWIVLQR